MKLTYDPRYNVAYLRLHHKTAEVETIRVSDELKRLFDFLEFRTLAGRLDEALSAMGTSVDLGPVDRDGRRPGAAAVLAPAPLTSRPAKSPSAPAFVPVYGLGKHLPPGIFLIDARPMRDFLASHVPGAQSVTSENLRASAGGVPATIYPAEVLGAVFASRFCFTSNDSAWKRRPPAGISNMPIGPFQMMVAQSDKASAKRASVTSRPGAGRLMLLMMDHGYTTGDFMAFRLNQSGPNRDAIGAWVTLRAGGRTLWRQVMPTRGYLSQSELPLTFGLGKATRVDELTVQWPDGTSQRVDPPTLNRLITITEP